MENRIQQHHFDVVLAGTSLINSVIGAALQKSGYSVLTVDSNQYYGSDLPTFTLEEFQAFLLHPPNEGCTSQEQAHPPGTLDSGGKCAEDQWHAELQGLLHRESGSDSQSPDANPDRPDRKALDESLQKAILGAKATTRFEPTRTQPETHSPLVRSAVVFVPQPGSAGVQDVTEKSRRFCLDLQPKLLLSQGSAVPLLLESGTSPYLEFQAINPLFIHDKRKGFAVQVPLSKSQVFKSPFMSGVDKRNLMRLLQLILGDLHNAEGSPSANQELVQSKRDVPFVQFLQEEGFSDQIIQTLVSGMLPFSAPCPLSEIQKLPTGQGIEYSRLFLSSVGKYGPGAFLYPNYGIGDIAQSFNRSCAVHDGTFILREPPRAFAIADDGSELTCTGLITNWGQYIHADVVISSLDYLPQRSLNLPDRFVQQHTAVVISSGPLSVDGAAWEDSCVGSIPAGALGNTGPVRILQLSHSHRVCPPGYYVTYFETSHPIPKSSIPDVSLSADPTSEPPTSHDLWNCVRHFFSVPNGEESKESKEQSDPPVHSLPPIIWSCFYIQCFPDTNDVLTPVPSSKNWFVSGRQSHAASLDAGVGHLESAFGEILRARAAHLNQKPPEPKFFEAAAKVVDEDERDPGFMDGLNEDDLAGILSESDGGEE